jgi:hypothetical protein
MRTGPVIPEMARRAGESHATVRTFRRMWNRWLLVTLLVVGVFVPAFSELTTCRCCLFTANKVCMDMTLMSRRGLSWPVGRWEAGRYSYSEAGSFVAGLYDRPGKGFPDYEYAHVRAERVRFGYPIKWATLDRVKPGTEWHLVAEMWTLPVNLVAMVVASIGIAFTRRRIIPLIMPGPDQR